MWLIVGPTEICMDGGNKEMTSPWGSRGCTQCGAEVAGKTGGQLWLVGGLALYFTCPSMNTSSQVEMSTTPPSCSWGYPEGTGRIGVK